MSDVSYAVRVQYQVDDAQAASKVKGLSSMFDGLGKAADAVSGVFDSMVGKIAAVGAAAGMAAAYAAVKTLNTGLVEVNSKLEDASLGFMTMFNMMSGTGVEGGLAMAKDLMGQIREDAASLPGEFGDFVSMAQTVTAPLLNAGKGIKEIRELTRDTVVAASAMGVQYDQASREMAQLLEGHAGGHNVLGTRLGITASTQVAGKEFNKASAAERFDFIEKSLSKAKDSLPAFQKSWSGLTSTFVDGFKRLAGEATAPLFERLKGAIEKANGLLDSPKATKLAKEVGEFLVRAYDFAVEKAEWLGAHWEQIKSTAVKFGEELRDAFEKVWPIVEKIGLFIGEKLQDPGKTLKELAMFRGGLAVASNAGSIAGGAEAVGGALAGAGGGALSVAAVAAVGAIDILTMKTEGMGDFFVWVSKVGRDVWSDIKTNFGEAIKETTAYLKDVWTAARPLVDLLGVALLGAIDGAIYWFRAVTWPMRMFAEAVKWAIHKVRHPFSTPDFDPSAADPSLQNAGLKTPWAPKEIKRDEVGWAAAVAEDAAKQAMADAKKTLPGSGKMNVTVNAPLTVLSDSDPERLAKAVATHVDEKMRNALTSRSLTAMRAF